MAPSAPLRPCTRGGPRVHYDLLLDAKNGSPTWARLITEQWLLFWSQYGSFSFMCVGSWLAWFLAKLIAIVSMCAITPSEVLP